MRDARAEDAEAFVRAYEVAWDAMAASLIEKRLADFASFESRLDGFRAGLAEASADARILVAEDGDSIVGIATCRREGATWRMVHHHASPYVRRPARSEGVEEQTEPGSPTARKRGVVN